MAKFYEIKALLNGTAEIFIYGDIGKDWWDDESVGAKEFCDQLNAITESFIDLHVNCFGGSVADGLAMYNALQRHPADIDGYIDGVAISMGSLVPMAANKVIMAENAIMMIHAPWGGIAGNATELRKYADVLDKYADAMATSYMAKSGKSKEQIDALLKGGDDHFFTASEALAEGFADSVSEAVKIAASGYQKRYTLPAAMAAAINQTGVKKMEKPETKAAKQTTVDPVKNKPQEQEISKDDILASEKSRRETIRAAFAKHLDVNGTQDILDACLDDPKIDIAASREKLLNHLGSKTKPLAGNPNIELGESSDDKFFKGAGQAIMARCGQDKADPQNEFRGYKMEDIARSCLTRSGRNLKGMDRMSIARAALTMRPSGTGFGQSTSDFPVLLENVMHKQVLTAYNLTPDTWTRFCKIGSVSDFREWLRLRVGSIGNLDQTNERGEYLSKALPDAKKEGVTAKRRGNIINITPEIIINDDLGYINDMTVMLGRAGKRTIEAEVYVLLASNPVLKDGIALFDAAHNNLAAAGAAPSIASIESARVAMATQMDIGGNDFLDINPSIFVGGMATGSTAREVNGQEYNDESNKNQRKPNVVRGLFNDLIDTARIAGNIWYLFADPTVAPVIEVVFLDGQNEPIVALEEDFNTAGVNYRVELPFGVGAIGYEGAYQDPGA